MTVSEIHSYIGPREVGPVSVTAAQAMDAFQDLPSIGVFLTEAQATEMASAYGMDALQPTVTTANINVPVQFLQSFLPGFTRVVTNIRQIDSLIGIATVGAWHDEEIVQGVLEEVSGAVLYGDNTNVPLSNYNANWERRTIVRFEQGLRVDRLEEARASAARLSAADSKRSSCTLALEISRNRTGFYGLNAGANRTYGYLNDPGLPAYVNVPNGAGGSSTWATKTFNEIIADLNSAAASLRTQSGGVVDPYKDKCTLAVALASIQYLATVNSLGTLSVRAYIEQTYPNWRIETAPELSAANGGANVFYLHAESIADGSTDGGAVWLQPVPAKLFTVGVAKTEKGYTEDFANATAGAMCRRPWAVVRRSGI